MEHRGIFPIQTERLLLRRFHSNDAEMMYDNWATDERVTKFLTWTPYKKIDEVRDFISAMIESYKSSDFYHWVIILDGQAVGSISVTSMDKKIIFVKLVIVSVLPIGIKGLQPKL